MSKKIKIHYVCRGNIFRSRLAEAYSKSLKVNEAEFTSSGIMPMFTWPHQIESHTRIIGNQNNLTPYFSRGVRQTTPELLEKADIVVFMRGDVFRDAKKLFDFDENKCLVWHVNDNTDWKKKLSPGRMRYLTFRLIRKRVNALVRDVKVAAPVDIVSEENEPLGFKMPISLATKKGLWHRGCHGVLTTPENNFIIQKRSNSVLFSPGLVEISLGGYVNAGEKPEQALVRETKEELGLKVAQKDLRPIETAKQSSYRHRTKRHSKAFVYTYHVPLESNEPKIKFDPDETATVKLVTVNKLRKLLKTHRMLNFGRLDYSYKYHERIVNKVLKTAGSKKKTARH